MRSINKTFLVTLLLLSFVVFASGQDAQELAAEKAANAKLKGEHPLVALAKEKPSSLRKDLVGVHPRVYMTQAEIDQLKEKAKTHKEL